MNKYTPELDENKEEDHHIWKRENAISKKIEQANQRFQDAERRIIVAEEAIKNIDLELENLENLKRNKASLEYELQKKAVISDNPSVTTPQDIPDDGMNQKKKKKKKKKKKLILLLLILKGLMIIIY